jgi:hypothetical protein
MLKCQKFKSTTTFLPTGRFIVGRDAPAQANIQRNHYYFRVVNLGGRIWGCA